MLVRCTVVNTRLLLTPSGRYCWNWPSSAHIQASHRN